MEALAAEKTGIKADKRLIVPPIKGLESHKNLEDQDYRFDTQEESVQDDDLEQMGKQWVFD